MLLKHFFVVVVCSPFCGKFLCFIFQEVAGEGIKISRQKCQEFFLCLWIDLLAVSDRPTFWPGVAVRKRLPGCAVEPGIYAYNIMIIKDFYPTQKLTKELQNIF